MRNVKDKEEKQYYLAIDIGASSGRHILGWMENGKIRMEEIYRFQNGLEKRGGHLCWNLDRLFDEVVAGLRECKRLERIPASVGIDTWGVDFVLLDAQGNVLGSPVAYRDSRTKGMDDVVYQTIPEAELYSRSGIQKQIFNTIYQLTAIRETEPEILDRADRFLMIPEYLNYRLTGVAMNEYTNATTTQLVSAKTQDWDWELLDRLGIPRKLFGELHMPKTLVGPLSDRMAEAVGFQTSVVLPATHDTGSAVMAVPATDDESIYLSSGTWSLMGIERLIPDCTEKSRAHNFTNEGGYHYRYRYLKNIMGLWIIQSIRRELNGTEYVEGRKSKYADGKNYSFPDLIAAARECADFGAEINVNDDAFLSPESMIDAIKDHCREHGQPVPEKVGEIMQCVYKGLAKCYADTIKEISAITGKTITSVNIIGGGCQDAYLNEMTAQATGLTVYAGPIEGTAIGNLAILMIASGELSDLQAARDVIYNSFEIKEFRA